MLINLCLLHNAELHNSYASQNIIRVIKTGGMQRREEIINPLQHPLIISIHVYCSFSTKFGKFKIYVTISPPNLVNSKYVTRVRSNTKIKLLIH